MEITKKIKWYNLGFMAFASVWGFGNVINGFGKYGGMQAISAWIIIFVLYFVPYALMVGEMGSAFKDLGGGVSSWIHETISPRIAYYAGWTYWVVHMPYISQKPQGALIALSWAVTGSGSLIDGMSPLVMQLISLAIFLVVTFIATKGINPLKNIATLAGSSMFVMSILFIVLMLTAPALTNGSFNAIDLSPSNILPKIDMKFIGSISLLVFAVGGCERISPYVNKMENPGKDFPKGMIFLTVMVASTAILGTIALSMIYSTSSLDAADFLKNGAYYAFRDLGKYYGVGNLFMIIYAICNVIGQLSVLVVSIDAPLRMLLDHTDKKYIPSKLFKQNKHGVYINGVWMVVVITSILIIIPGFLSKDTSGLFTTILELNATTMPLRYLWVFVAYIALKRMGGKFTSDYKFTKSKILGYIVGVWCFAFTAVACVAGMFDGNIATTIMKIVTPFILLLLGLLLPRLAKRERIKNGEQA